LPAATPSRREARSVPHAAWLGGVAVVYALSVLVFGAAGLRFDDAVYGFYQVLPADLLHDRLIESVWYLHIQPPLFNLFLGLGLRAPEPLQIPFFAAVYALLALALALAVFAAQVNLGVPRALALVVTAVLIVNPALILFRNLLTYELPVMALLALAAWSLTCLKRGRSWPLAIFYPCVVAVCLTRSLFHPLWLVGALAMVEGLRFRARREQPYRLVPLVTGLAGVGLVGLFLLKSLLLFGSPSLQSWFGMNLYKMAQDYSGLAADASNVPIAAYENPFRPFGEYAPEYSAPAPTGIPALDRPWKDGAYPNFNYAGYLPVYRDYLARSLTRITANPRSYVTNVGRAAYVFSRPATEGATLFYSDGSRENERRLRAWEALYDALFYGSLDESSGLVNGYRLNYLILLWPILLFFLLFELRKRMIDLPEQAYFYGFVLVTFVYLTAAGVLLDIGENNRFRFNAEGLLAILVGILASRLVAYLRTRVQAWRPRTLA
jgi:hypothetical protein